MVRSLEIAGQEVTVTVVEVVMTQTVMMVMIVFADHAAGM